MPQLWQTGVSVHKTNGKKMIMITITITIPVDNDNDYGDDNANRLFLAYPFNFRNGVKDYASW